MASDTKITQKIAINFKPAFLGGHDIWEQSQELGKKISTEEIKVTISSIDGIYESYPDGQGIAADLGRNYQEIAREFFELVGPMKIIMSALIVISSGFLGKIGSNLADAFWKYIKSINKKDAEQFVVLKIEREQLVLIVKLNDIRVDDIDAALTKLGQWEAALFEEMARNGKTKALITYKSGDWIFEQWE